MLSERFECLHGCAVSMSQAPACYVRDHGTLVRELSSQKAVKHLVLKHIGVGIVFNFSVSDDG